MDQSFDTFNYRRMLSILNYSKMRQGEVSLRLLESLFSAVRRILIELVLGLTESSKAK